MNEKVGASEESSDRRGSFAMEKFEGALALFRDLGRGRREVVSGVGGGFCTQLGDFKTVSTVAGLSVGLIRGGGSGGRAGFVFESSELFCVFRCCGVGVAVDGMTESSFEVGAGRAGSGDTGTGLRRVCTARALLISLLERRGTSGGGLSCASCMQLLRISKNQSIPGGDAKQCANRKGAIVLRQTL